MTSVVGRLSCTRIFHRRTTVLGNPQLPLRYSCNSPPMRPMLVNTRQKIAVLASGLAIATTGFVTDADASNAVAPSAQPAQSGVALAEEAPGDELRSPDGHPASHVQLER